jgi:hypothetical protein
VYVWELGIVKCAIEANCIMISIFWFSEISISPLTQLQTHRELLYCPIRTDSPVQVHIVTSCVFTRCHLHSISRPGWETVDSWDAGSELCYLEHCAPVAWTVKASGKGQRSVEGFPSPSLMQLGRRGRVRRGSDKAIWVIWICGYFQSSQIPWGQPSLCMPSLTNTSGEGCACF